MVNRVLFLTCSILQLATVAQADDDRDRKARAALALAKSDPAAIATVPVVAPAPRAAKPKDYATGYAESKVEQLPLVVYVGCDAPTKLEGAIVSHTSAPDFAGCAAPCVVVGYPVGDRLFVDAKLPGKPDTAAVKEAVKNAARKIDQPRKDMPPAPKPLDWQIRALPAESCVTGT